ncbi:MAG: hypothetical protein J5527_12540 [Treponema sp.]|nr:hypothetical protein [Treponema sp.]
MSDFEKMYERLEELLLKKFPEYIEKWKKENFEFERFELKTFTNICINPGTDKVPYFAMTFSEAEQAKKDRIINNINYKFNFEFFYEKDGIPDFEKTLIYQQIIVEMLSEDDFEYWQNIEITKLTSKKFDLVIHVEW